MPWLVKELQYTVQLPVSQFQDPSTSWKIANFCKQTKCLKLFVNPTINEKSRSQSIKVLLKLEIWENWSLISRLTAQDKLQEFVWFNLCYYLGRRGSKRRLARTYKKLPGIQTRRPRQGICHHKAYRAAKNYQGGYKQKDQDYTDVRMYEIPVSPMDPIAAVNSCSVNLTKSVRRGTRTGLWGRIQLPNWCQEHKKTWPFSDLHRTLCSSFYNNKPSSSWSWC